MCQLLWHFDEKSNEMNCIVRTMPEDQNEEFDGFKYNGIAFEAVDDLEILTAVQLQLARLIKSVEVHALHVTYLFND